MGRFSPKQGTYAIRKIGGKDRTFLLTEGYDSFNPSLLGLGDITQPAVSADAIAAVFDLEGFTNFCKQIEPQLSVPHFLSEFLSWLLADIRREMTQRQDPDGALLYGPLPFFVKFMGDGLLLLWDVASTDDVGRRNIVLSSYEVCEHYQTTFLPRIRATTVEAPPRLRCGLARGTVYSVGNGQDFVGSCINMSTRIQKLPGVTFAFNRRGFNLEDSGADEFFKEAVVVKRLSIRGIGENELVAVLRKDYEALVPMDRTHFRDL